MRKHEKPRNTEPRCKAKVFVLLPAWKSNAVWANAACVGHPKNLEALRAAGADVEAWVALNFDPCIWQTMHCGSFPYLCVLKGMGNSII